jgi:putative membrane protein
VWNRTISGEPRRSSRSAVPRWEEVTVISRYTDHAANERTFLAWVRTGIATIAFGFVIEKFNLFMLTIAAATPGLGKEHHLLGRLSGLLGQYDGTALIFVGIALIVVAAIRFVRTTRLIDDEETHTASSIRAELVLSLVLILAAIAAYAALD